MAAFNYDDFADPSEGGYFQSIVNWGGAILSVLLIAGLATWGWKLWQRDVSGIPVVRALEGPMRVAPEDPGGLASEYQGLAVNRIAEERAEETVEQVVLAPAPATLDESEDLTLAELQPSVVPTVEVEDAPVFGTDAAVAAVATEAEKVLEPTPAVLTADAPSATDLAVAAALSGLDLSGEESVFANATLTAPRSIPRPIGRPEGVRLASLAPVMNDVTGDIDPTTIPPGTRLVQLGAYGSQEVARAEWANAIANFGNYMAGKDRVIQEAETGGRTFWRLRAMGFDGLADARRFCAVLVADGANCIPVVQE